MKGALKRSHADLCAQVWWHGGKAPLDLATIDWAHPLHGGLHIGTQAQARMRGRVLTALRIDGPLRLRTSRDEGGNWARRAKAARSAGYDAIQYLNRYEGIDLPTGNLDELDRLTDAAFRRRVPQADTTLIILRAACVRIIPHP